MMKENHYSIISLILTLIIPTVIYFIRIKKKDYKTPKDVAVKYFLFFGASILLVLLSYLFFKNMYLSIGLLFVLGVIGLFFLTRMKNKVGKEDIGYRK